MLDVVKDVVAEGRSRGDSIDGVLGVRVLTLPSSGGRDFGASSLASSVREAAAEGAGFVVLDLHRAGLPPAGSGDGMSRDALLDALSSVVVATDTLSVAWLRGHVGGFPLQLALGCHLAVAEEGTTVSFDPEILDFVHAYGSLSRRLGYLMTERLMETAKPWSARSLLEIGLLADVVPDASGREGLEAVLARRSKKHHASCGIHRALRVVA